MSLFGGLDDGVVESIPTLIDEDLEDLFAGEALVLLLPMASGTGSAGVPSGIIAASYRSCTYLLHGRYYGSVRDEQIVETICARSFATTRP